MLNKTIFYENVEKQIRDLAIPYDYDTKEYPIEVLLYKYNYISKENNHPQLFIPDYLRDLVWSDEVMSKFIESLFLGVPIQPLFVATNEDGRLEVIDGSQRIRAINKFVKEGLILTGLTKITTLNGFGFADLSRARQNRFNLISVRLYVITDKANHQIRQDIFNRINVDTIMLNEPKYGIT